MSVFIMTLDVKTLPDNLVIKRSPSLLYYGVYMSGKLVYQDKKKWQCIRWLQDNPSMIEAARLLTETNFGKDILKRKISPKKEPVNKGWGHLL